jgi:hypothetical protein
MKKPIHRRILSVLPVLACALPGFAQTYTDEQINTSVCNLPQPWNMLTQANSYQQYCYAFPSGFNSFNIIGTGIFIHSDRSPIDGRSMSASTLYRLHTTGQTDQRSFGGEYAYWCYGTQCDVEMKRGSSTVPRNYYQTTDFDNTALLRVFAVTEYINTGVGPAAKTSTDYYFPIGPWNMNELNSDNNPKTKKIPLPGLDINRIANVSTIILSDPDNWGKVKADQFDRRGMLRGTLDPNVLLKRGGIMEVKPDSTNRSVTNVELKRFNTATFSPYPNMLFSGTDYDGLGTNRGWVKVTYFGSVSGLTQPVAIKTLVKPIGAWPISARKDPSNPNSTNDRYRLFDYSQFGVAANRLVSADVTIHQDILGGTHAVAPLKRTPTDGVPSGGDESGLFTIDEPNSLFRIFATYDDQGTSSRGYYSQNHFSGAPYNRGYYRIDYVAGTCATAATGYSIKGIPSATNGTCGGGSGSLTTVEGAGRDIWDASDEFTYMYKLTSGDKTFIAKIESQSNTEGWAKAGIMFRSSLAANAKHASLLATPANGTHFTWRPDGTNTVTSRTSNSTVKAPYWLRIQKVGKVFTASWSATGPSNWSPPIGSQTINSFGTNYYVGFAVSSRTPKMSRVVFSNVSGI